MINNPGATKKATAVAMAFSWSQQGMILRPPDYESGATNQLSYGTFFLLLFGDFCVGAENLKNKLRKSFKELIIFAPSGFNRTGMQI